MIYERHRLHPTQRSEYILIFYPVVVEQGLVVVLCGEASITQIFPDCRPLLQTAIVEHLQLVRNDERHNTIRQAFLKHNKPADTAVAVLERVYCLETLVQVQNIIKRFFLLQ